MLLFSYSFLSRGIRTELCRPFPPHGLLLHQQVKSPHHHYCKLLDIHISAVSFKAPIYCFCFCYLKTIITKPKKEELVICPYSTTNLGQNKQTSHCAGALIASSSSEGILTQSQSRVSQDTQSFRCVLGFPVVSLCLDMSEIPHLGGIFVRLPNHLCWLLLIWRSSSSSLSPP